MKVLASLLAAAHGQYNSAYDDWGQNSTDYYDYESGRMSTAIFYPNIAATIDELAMPPIKCWTCKNARNGRECRRDGYVQQCESNEQVCEIEVRKRNGKRVESVSTGCKWRRACLDNKRQNFIDANKWQHQCRPAKWHHTFNKGPSVCRQCCDINRAGQLDEECGLKFIEEYKGKAPPQKPRWREDLLRPYCDCKIKGDDPMVTIIALTGTEKDDDSDGIKHFRPVKSGCVFDWIVMNNPSPINDFEKGKTDTFEYSFSEIHMNPDCLRDIDQIEIMDESGNGWGAEWVHMIVKDVEHCNTETYEFDGPFWVDNSEVTATKTIGSKDEHCLKRECTIDGTEPKVTIELTTANEAGADSDREKAFRLVSDKQECTFEWIKINNSGDDFERGQTDVYDFDMKEVHINPHCLQDIQKIEIKEGTCKGADCDSWKAEKIEVIVKDVYSCETDNYEFNGDFSLDLAVSSDTADLIKTSTEDHWK